MSEDQRARIAAYWEDPKVESMADHHLAALEAEMIARYIDTEDRVLDLGCGDGSGSAPTRAHCTSYLGMDRSSMMLARFSANAPGVQLVQADMAQLPFRIGDFSVIVSQRALINLPEQTIQLEVLKRLPAILCPGGKLILCEAFTEGVEKLNHLRQELGCAPIQERWHNRFLDRTLTAQALSTSMDLEAEEDLSLYYFLTRVLHQALVGEALPYWDSPFNRIARQIAQSRHAPNFNGYSTLVMQIWRRNDASMGACNET